MALFGRKTDTKQKTAKTPAKQAAGTFVSTERGWHPGRVLGKPRITEKSTNLAARKNVYVFNVHQDANKPLIKRAIQELYGVVPKKVNIITDHPKKVMRRGQRPGKKTAQKKAYVFLADGDRIDIV